MAADHDNIDALQHGDATNVVADGRAGYHDLDEVVLHVNSSEAFAAADLLTTPFTMTSEFAAADQGAGQLQQTEVQISLDLVADPQPLELMQPGEGALHDPAGAPESRAVSDTAAGDARSDAPLSQSPASDGVVVTAVGIQVARPQAGPARTPRTAGEASTSGSS